MKIKCSQTRNAPHPCRWLTFVVAVLVLVSCQSQQPDASSLDGKPSTVSAAISGDLNLLRQLEDQKQSLDFKDPRMFDWTPLIGAIYHQQTNIIQYLLTKEIDLNLQDRKGYTALIMAIITEDTNTVRRLLGCETNSGS